MHTGNEPCSGIVCLTLSFNNFQSIIILLHLRHIVNTNDDVFVMQYSLEINNDR